MPQGKSKGRAPLVVSAVAILISSFLIFFIQPAVTKVFLPIFGGSPAVWNVCAMFFQIMLLAGYLFAHALQKLRPRGEVIVYFSVLAVSMLTLPIGMPELWTPDWEHGVSLNLLYGLFLTAGIPFFCAAAASPLIQRWFSHSRHHSAGDPYYLYALSNTGSLAALLSYPLLIEPWFTVDLQLGSWSIGFILYAAAMLILRLTVSIPESARDLTPQDIQPAESVPLTTKVKWVVLAFIPSSLSLGATQHLSTDVAAFPLLWVAPLSLYLLSYILAFAKSARRIVKICEKLFPLALIPVVMLLATSHHHYLSAQIILHLFGLFIVAVCAHAKLAAMRPSVAYLTSYYLFLSIGGALGGVFNSLIAPLIFNSIFEYIIAISLACIFAWPKKEKEGEAQLTRFKHRNLSDDVYVSLLAVTLLICCSPVVRKLGIEVKVGALSFANLLELTLPALLLLSSLFMRRRFVIMASLLMLFPHIGLLNSRRTLLSERTFFGVLRVQ